MRAFVLFLICIAAAALAAPALGAPPGKKADQKIAKEARDQFAQGISLYESGKYEQAAIAFARAYELNPSYKLLYNIGQVENQLEHYAAALTAYSRYLEEGGVEVGADRRAEVQGELARLGTLVGYIRVTAPVDGAKVKLNNEVVGVTPLAEPLRVDMGKHEVVVSSGGEDLHSELVKVAGGQTVEVVVERKVAAEIAPPPPAEEAPKPAEPPAKPKRVWTWVAGGVGVAAGIAAAATFGVASSKSKDLEGACGDGHCPESEWETLDQARRLATATDVLIAVAATGVTAGVVLFFIEPRIGERNAPVVVPTPTEGGAALAVSGRF